MLLNKYETYELISKDGHAEELLFKIEKNYELKQSLELKCFQHLHAFVGGFKKSKSEKLAIEKCDYEPLEKYARKLVQLASNVEVIYAAFAKRLNKKVQNEEQMVECFLLCRQVGDLVAVMCKELKGRGEMILNELPAIIFRSQHRDQSFCRLNELIEEDQRVLSLDYVYDLWTFKNASAYLIK